MEAALPPPRDPGFNSQAGSPSLCRGDKVPISRTFHDFPISSITVPERARFAKGNIQELADSLNRHGLLHPITVSRDGTLVAGERRLLAAQKLGWSHIPIQFLDELDTYERRSVELEENVRRLDFNWIERAQLISDYHKHRSETDDDWDLEETADALGLNHDAVVRQVTVIRAVESGNEELLKADNYTSAHRMLEVKRQRELDNETADFLATPVTDPLPAVGVAPPPAPPVSSILLADFHEWGPAYTGPQFNIGHFDFPYGIMQHRSDQGGADHFETYTDTPETFWALIGTLGKCVKAGNLFMPYSHFIVWFSMKFYEKLREELTTMGLKVNRSPLVWHKSDTTGICPDVKRMPRQVYETAFLCTLGDRFINAPLANAFSFPGRKTGIHLSHKPVEMLRHFLGLVVDESARVLDPTCGSGSALVAAEQLGANHVLGLDTSPEHVATATTELNRARLAK